MSNLNDEDENEDTRTDPFGYAKMTKSELEGVVTELTKQRLQLQDDKKEWVSAANEAIKEINTRTSQAVEVLRDLEARSTNLAQQEENRQFRRDEATATA